MTVNVNYDATFQGAPDDSAADVSFTQSGTGAIARTAQDKMREIVTPYDFGAVGDNVADDTAAIQAFVNAVVAGRANGDWADGAYRITSTVTVTPASGAWFNFKGRGSRSAVVMVTDGMAAFNFNVTGIGDVSYCGWTDLTTIHVAATTNPAAVHYRITGDAALFQHMDWSGNTAINGYAVWKDEKLPRTTAFGQEGAMCWNRYTGVRAINVTQYVFWGTNGTGTGNAWVDLRAITSAANSAVFRFEGVGCVVGDVILQSVHAGCNDAVTGSALVSIGASTVYRAQWAINSCQFDANCNRVVEQDGTGAIEYVNWRITANNHGGSSDLGTVQPLSRSIVEDRHASRWESGVYQATSSTGVQALDCFEVTFADYGSATVTLTATALVGGVAACASEYTFTVRADAANTFGVEQDALLSEDTQLTWTFSDLGSKQGKFTLAYTPSSTGTTVEVTAMARGRKFKLRRMVLN